MKKFAWVLVTALALLAVSVAPVLADDLPEAGTAAPGAFVDVSGGVAGKGGAPAAPPVGTVKLSKTGSKWIESYVTKLSWGNYVLRGVEPWKGRPVQYIEQSCTKNGVLENIFFQRLAGYMCAPGMGCSPWAGWLGWDVASFAGYTWWCTGCPAHSGVGVKSVSRHTFSWWWGGVIQTFDTYAIVSGWVTP